MGFGVRGVPGEARGEHVQQGGEPADHPVPVFVLALNVHINRGAA